MAITPFKTLWVTRTGNEVYETNLQGSSSYPFLVEVIDFTTYQLMLSNITLFVENVLYQVVDSLDNTSKPVPASTIIRKGTKLYQTQGGNADTGTQYQYISLEVFETMIETGVTAFDENIVYLVSSDYSGTSSNDIYTSNTLLSRTIGAVTVVTNENLVKINGDIALGTIIYDSVGSQGTIQIISVGQVTVVTTSVNDEGDVLSFETIAQSNVSLGTIITNITNNLFEYLPRNSVIEIQNMDEFVFTNMVSTSTYSIQVSSLGDILLIDVPNTTIKYTAPDGTETIFINEGTLVTTSMNISYTVPTIYNLKSEIMKIDVADVSYLNGFINFSFVAEQINTIAQVISIMANN